MKFMIAGLGSVGRRHFRNLRELGEHDILLYRTHRATLPDNELRGVPVETDLTAALASKPRAVIVSNPTAFHLDVAIAAAEMGCAILMEKPISCSLDRVDELENASFHSGSRILVGFQFRFHPTMKKAAELIRSGTIGNVMTAHAHWGEYLPGWHPWEDYRETYAARSEMGGGVLLTLMHPLDYVRWLIGEVERVYSFNGKISPLDIDVEDTAEIGLRFANGAVGGVHLNYVQRPPAHRWEIVGSGGTLRWNSDDGVLHCYSTPGDFGSWDETSSKTLVERFSPEKGFDRNIMFLEEMRHFIQVARGEAEPVCTLHDGKRALQLALAAYHSSEHSTVVRLT